MAKIGLGIRMAARLLGHPNQGRVASAWAIRGIQKTPLPDGSWDLYARRRGLCQKTKAIPVLPWWGDDEAASGWMSNAKARFPDWSYFWLKEYATRKANAKYHSLTAEEKLEWNRRLMANRMASPEQAAKYKEKGKRWRDANRQARRDYNRKWKEQNPERWKELTKRARKKRDAKPEVRIVSNFRKRLRDIMKDAREGGKQSTLFLIGCSSSALARHLESNFKRGMTWENYGTHWHVDHIIPCAAFDHTKPEQVRQCWHFTNLRPLEAKANITKGAKIEAPQLQLLLTH
jgi:hypothetical protein